MITFCPVVQEFWNNLKKWIQKQFNLYLDLSPHTIIFGILEKDIGFLETVLFSLQKKSLLIVAATYE